MELQDILFEGIFKLNEGNIETLKTNMNNAEESVPWAFCLGAGVSIQCHLVNGKSQTAR